MADRRRGVLRMSLIKELEDRAVLLKREFPELLRRPIWVKRELDEIDEKIERHKRIMS